MSALRQPDTTTQLTGTVIAGFKCPSDSGIGDHDILIYSDGKIYCNGPCWKWQSKAQIEKKGLFNGARRCKHTERYEPHVPRILRGELKAEMLGGKTLNGVPQFPDLPPVSDADFSKLDSNLRKRFVRG